MQLAEVHRAARVIQAGAEMLEQLRADNPFTSRNQQRRFQQGRQHAEGQRDIVQADLHGQAVGVGLNVGDSLAKRRHI